jgi:class I fructose-bisphosphate aldolase
MKTARLNRLFNANSGRCFDVAVDHGFFNEPGFLKGIESIPKVIDTLVDACPDAIQLTLGQARHLQSHPGRLKPSLVLRTDTANIYGKQLPEARFSTMIEDAALQAVQLDAACVCVNLFQIPGAPDITDQCVDNIMRLKVECDTYSMPMMVEPLVFAPNDKAGGYMVDGEADKIIHLVRQAVEFGADIIKADPTDDISLYHKIIETAGGGAAAAGSSVTLSGGIPVLVRGGGKVDDRTILTRTAALLDQGVHGIVYGRNVIQHDNPAGITKALMAMLHENATVDIALTMVE